jgi:hypothetical protein
VLANRATAPKAVREKHAAPSARTANARMLLSKLEAETSSGSYGALDTFAALKGVWPGRASGDLARLEKALARFDTGSAISLIAKLGKKLEGGRS